MTHSPEVSNITPGTDGLSNMPSRQRGFSKRGGAHVIYLYYDMDTPLYLLLVYAKPQATDIGADENKAVAALAAAIKGRR